MNTEQIAVHIINMYREQIVNKYLGNVANSYIYYPTRVLQLIYLSNHLFVFLVYKETHFHQLKHSKHLLLCGLYYLLQIYVPTRQHECITDFSHVTHVQIMYSMHVHQVPMRVNMKLYCTCM